LTFNIEGFYSVGSYLGDYVATVDSRRKGGIKNMNKSGLIDHIAAKTKLTKKAISDVLESFMDGVVATVKKGDSVTLTGFGTFKAMKRQARTGRNPQTGATIKIPARTVPVFRPGKEFKDKVK